MIRIHLLLLIGLTFSLGADVKSARTAGDSDELITALESNYSRQDIEETLETHPILELYLNEDEIETGKAAVKAHMERIEPRERERFQTTLERILIYRKLLGALTNDLANGFHDVAFTHGRTKDLYKPFLKVYSLDSNNSTVEDVASSLSTIDEARILTRLARRLALWNEDQRLGFLGDLLNRIDSVPPEK